MHTQLQVMWEGSLHTMDLFTERGTKLLSYANYLQDIQPGKEGTWTCVSDVFFNLIEPAQKIPGYISIKFDDIYIVNHIIFTGESLQTKLQCDTEEPPFCYEVKAMCICISLFVCDVND